MSESTRKPGRPRDEAAREAILAAAFGLLAGRGYGEMAVESVALRAGVGKTTIYRWWKTRQELAVEAFFTATRAELAFPDTGSAAADFRSQIHQLAGLLRGDSGSALVAMIVAAKHDPTLRAAILSRWVVPRRRWGQERMARVVQSGECRPGLNPDVALELLYSPIYARLLFGMGIPSTGEVDAALDLAFTGIFVGPGRPAA